MQLIVEFNLWGGGGRGCWMFLRWTNWPLVLPLISRQVFPDTAESFVGIKVFNSTSNVHCVTKAAIMQRDLAVNKRLGSGKASHHVRWHSSCLFILIIPIFASRCRFYASTAQHRLVPRVPCSVWSGLVQKQKITCFVSTSVARNSAKISAPVTQFVGRLKSVRHLLWYRWNMRHERALKFGN